MSGGLYWFERYEAEAIAIERRKQIERNLLVYDIARDDDGFDEDGFDRWGRDRFGRRAGEPESYENEVDRKWRRQKIAAAKHAPTMDDIFLNDLRYFHIDEWRDDKGFTVNERDEQGYDRLGFDEDGISKTGKHKDEYITGVDKDGRDPHGRKVLIDIPKFD